MRCGSAVVILVAALIRPAAAQAEAGQHVAVRYSAPEVCPDDAQLVSTIEGYLGQPLAESREQDLAVAINVQGQAGGFSAKLAFKGPHGPDERFLEHPDCRKLIDASALLVALAIDPERVKARLRTESSPTTAPTDTPAVS